jgi:hypothetical protein
LIAVFQKKKKPRQAFAMQTEASAPSRARSAKQRGSRRSPTPIRIAMFQKEEARRGNGTGLRGASQRGKSREWDAAFLINLYQPNSFRPFRGPFLLEAAWH